MAGKGHLTVKIGGDASDFQKALKGVERDARSAAAALGQQFKKAGMDSTQAMNKAWAEIKKAQQNGTTVTINGVETIISKNKQIINQKDDLGSTYDALGGSAEKASNRIRMGLADIKAGIDIVSAAGQKLIGVASKGINYNATLESLQTSFEVMTGSAEKAAEVVERLRRMGAETPFETQDLVATTQLLMQYGFTADDAIEKMSMLGDIAQGNAQAMNSIALGYAQMSSAAKVNLVDIKQMINAGFNPLQEISERTGESMASLYDRISKGTMSVDEITASMVAATSEGGKFFQSMEKQSQTLSGQLSTLKDNADQLLGSLTEGLSEGLRDELLPLANNMIGSLQSAFEQGGVQGLTDAATEMIPDLLDMMSGEFEDGIAAIGKWLPKGASALMHHVPQALRGASSVIPQITTALFEVATVVVTDLTAMLPELIPILIDGFADMLASSLRGIESLIGGLFTGINQAIHKGQTQIAGVWVDDSQLAKYTFDMEMDVEPAKSTIAQAYADIRAALQTDLLTPEQRSQIEGMIGEDYDAIYAKLKSFGLSDADAGSIATQVTTASDTLKAEIDKLDIGVDSATVVKWMAQAGGSRIRLKAAMKQAGLNDSDQAEIIELFNTMTGNITGSLPNVIDEIYSTLTDGILENDNKDELNKLFEQEVGQLLGGVETWLQEHIDALDSESATYSQEVAALTEEANGYKTEILNLQTEMAMLIDSLAGQPTAVVQARMVEFAAIEARLAEINAYIDETTANALSAAENAFRVVRSGAKTDEATISQAISFKVSQFKLDEQSAEDAYNAVVQDLNAKLAKKEITTGEYNAQMESATADLEAAKATARAAYEQALREIFGGIAESEGVDQQMAGLAQKMDLTNALNQLSTTLAQSDLFGSEAINEQLGENFTNMLAEHLKISPEQLKSKTIDEIRSALDSWAIDLQMETQDALESFDNTKVQETYGAALKDGVLAGTSFDTPEAELQFATLLSGMYESAASAAAPVAESAGKTLVESAEIGGEGSETAGNLKGSDYGSGYVQGVRSWANAAYSAGYALGQETARGTAAGQQSASPSKVAMGLGGDFGEGYTIGLQESMARAAQVARQLTGGIATSVDITQSMRVSNMPNLQQEIAVANEQNKTPVYLDGVQIAEIQGHNNSTQLAWRNIRAAKGVGSR